MSLRMRKLFVVLLVVLVAAVPAVAQEGGQTGGSGFFKYVSFDAGLRVGFDLDTENLALVRYFAFGITLSDSLEAQYVNIGGSSGITDYNLIRFNVALSGKFGFGINAGTVPVANSVVYGFGLFYDVMKNGGEDSLKNALRVSLDYLKTDGVSGGTLLLGLSARFGY